jgi:hypothetical protein
VASLIRLSEVSIRCLPVPKDAFMLVLRMHWPKENLPSIVDQSSDMTQAVKTNKIGLETVARLSRELKGASPTES